MSKPAVAAAKPPAPPPPEPPKPSPPLRDSLDLRRGGRGWQVVLVTYGDGLCEEKIALDSDSASFAVAEFTKLMRKKMYPAVTGLDAP